MRAALHLAFAFCSACESTRHVAEASVSAVIHATPPNKKGLIQDLSLTFQASNAFWNASLCASDGSAFFSSASLTFMYCACRANTPTDSVQRTEPPRQLRLLCTKREKAQRTAL
jgi:hypothetical protein